MLKAGYDVRWANDKDAYACDAFRHRIPSVRLLAKDIAEVYPDDDNIEPVDVLVGGFPCQPFSVAGPARGFEDERSNTFYEAIRLARTLSPKPKCLILENVPHVRRWMDRLAPALNEAGYHFGNSNVWEMNVKDVTGIPQDRSRIFMCAFSMNEFSHNPFSPPPPKNGALLPLADFIDKSQQADPSLYLPKDSKYYKLLADKIESGDARNLFHLRRTYVREKQGELCPTLTASIGLGGHNVPFLEDRWGIRKLSPTEVARLQGFEDLEVFPVGMSRAQKYRLVGNAVCVQMACLVATEIRKVLEQ